jgi:hypothetical protein
MGTISMVNLAGAAFWLAVIWGTAWAFRRLWRRSRARGRTAKQTAFLWLATAEAVHLLLRDHVDRESARLTESVMGPEREQRWP